MEYGMIENEKDAIEAVKNDGHALMYVKDQTEAICIEAVKNDCHALQYVKDRELFNKLNEQFS